MITVKHRRACEEDWLEHDPVIPDGEIALVSTECGYDIKIGDGVRRFSTLPRVMGSHTEDDMDMYPYAQLHHRDHACFGTVESIEIDLLTDNQPDFTAMLTFRTEDIAPEIIFYSSNIVFSGCDIEDGVFVPHEYKKYTLIFWRDTEMNCHVRGVYAE